MKQVKIAFLTIKYAISYADTTRPEAGRIGLRTAYRLAKIIAE